MPHVALALLGAVLFFFPEGLDLTGTRILGALLVCAAYLMHRHRDTQGVNKME